MANQEHLDILKQGVDVWNKWREKNPSIIPDLSRAELSMESLGFANLRYTNLYEAHLPLTDLHEAILFGAGLSSAYLNGANLRGANLCQANLRNAYLNGEQLHRAHLCEAQFHGAHLSGADFSDADFSRAFLSEAFLTGSNLSDANLSDANLTWSDFSRANLSRAHLKGANLSGAILIGTNFTGADLTNCLTYGISVWDIQLEGAKQFNLVITPPDQPKITVDNLEVAQFIYLLLNNKKIRDVIDTITSKVVLILGRFTEERKMVLDALRDDLRKQKYLPVLFDFEKPASRDLTETVSILAHLARFIIIDLTDPSSAPHEVATSIPQCIVPVQPLLLEDEGKPRHEYAMFQDLRTRYHWVLPTYQYKNIASLLVSFKENVIVPAERKAQELAKR